MERKLELHKPTVADVTAAERATNHGQYAWVPDPTRMVGYLPKTPEKPPTWMGPGAKRTFASGATRDTDQGKLDPEGFLNPEVLLMFSEFMHFNRNMADGSLRDSDNWQKGMPHEVYMKSLLRHTMALWRDHRGTAEVGPRAGELTAIMFNAMGYLFSLIEEFGPDEVKCELLAFLSSERMKQKGF